MAGPSSTFKRIILLFLLSTSTSIYSQEATMNRARFNEIELGTPVEQVVEKCGSPYQIYTRKDGSQEYKYLERILMGEETVQEYRYLILIKDGKVFSKRVVRQFPPAYNEIYNDDPNNFSQLDSLDH